MFSRTRSSLVNISALLIMALALVVIFHPSPFGVRDDLLVRTEQTAATGASSMATSSTTIATTSPAVATSTTKEKENAPHKASVAPASKEKPKAVAPVPKSAPAAAPTEPVFEIFRIENPYPTSPRSFDDVNVTVRGALVNILCVSAHGTSIRPISGSGVIIDPRGVILTNAHVAQYVLLAQSPRIDLHCTIRVGSPAASKWKAQVLFIPPVWVSEHVKEINMSRPMGTGEHDYALLRITGSVDGSPLSSTFPFLSFDTREVIGFLGDPVLGAGYPAEFVGGYNAQNNLYAVSSVSKIEQLMTFAGNTVDAFSIGGVIEAQSGSSGGPVVNAWDKLIGVITTTSEGATTADRTLHALTLSYIERDLRAQTGQGLSSYLEGDLAAKEQDFNTTWLLRLIDMYIKQIGGNN
ncbi:trypsin-like peptidase domain-containing protein [Candidatus Kaiserbacteria bacterium]|nr:trypsin-like peptidase domain-containing protein [Candidatus Kaiserbacteria bacterium]